MSKLVLVAMVHFDGHMGQLFMLADAGFVSLRRTRLVSDHRSDHGKLVEAHPQQVQITDPAVTVALDGFPDFL